MTTILSAGVALALFVVDGVQRAWWRLRRRTPRPPACLRGEVESRPQPIRLASLQGPSVKGFNAQHRDRRAHVMTLKRRGP